MKFAKNIKDVSAKCFLYNSIFFKTLTLFKVLKIYYVLLKDNGNFQVDLSLNIFKNFTFICKEKPSNVKVCAIPFPPSRWIKFFKNCSNGGLEIFALNEGKARNRGFVMGGWEIYKIFLAFPS